jgi:hypothetical protein
MNIDFDNIIKCSDFSTNGYSILKKLKDSVIIKINNEYFYISYKPFSSKLQYLKQHSDNIFFSDSTIYWYSKSYVDGEYFENVFDYRGKLKKIMEYNGYLCYIVDKDGQNNFYINNDSFYLHNDVENIIVNADNIIIDYAESLITISSDDIYLQFIKGVHNLFLLGKDLYYKNKKINKLKSKNDMQLLNIYDENEKGIIYLLDGNIYYNAKLLLENKNYKSINIVCIYKNNLYFTTDHVLWKNSEKLNIDSNIFNADFKFKFTNIGMRRYIESKYFLCNELSNKYKNKILLCYYKHIGSETITEYHETTTGNWWGKPILREQQIELGNTSYYYDLNNNKIDIVDSMDNEIDEKTKNEISKKYLESIIKNSEIQASFKDVIYFYQFNEVEYIVKYNKLFNTVSFIINNKRLNIKIKATFDNKSLTEKKINGEIYYLIASKKIIIVPDFSVLIDIYFGKNNFLIGAKYCYSPGINSFDIYSKVWYKK